MCDRVKHKAKYMALAGTVQEAVWLRELCKHMNTEQTSPTHTYKDNQSSLFMF